MLGLSFVNEMETMQRELDQLFRGFGFNSELEQQRQQFNFKVQDNETDFSITAALPGLDIETLDIEILGKHLTVAGEIVALKQPDNVRWHRQERPTGTFVQDMHLATDVDTDNIIAEFKNGVLHLTLPKATSALPQKIAVNAV